MPTITDRAVLDAPTAQVWALLRDFAAIGDWHPFLPPVQIENGPADRVGATRVFPELGGHRETLVALHSLQDLGYTIPPQADAGWIGEAGPGPSYSTPGPADRATTSPTATPRS